MSNKDENPIACSFKYRKIQLLKKDVSVRSRPFWVGCCEKEWYLQLYPRGCTSRDMVSVFLCRLCKCPVRVMYQFTLLCGTSLLKSAALHHKFLKDQPRWGFPTFIACSSLFSPGASTSQNVVLLCEIIESVIDVQPTPNLQPSATEPIPTASGAKDITLLVDGVEFKTSKTLLEKNSQFLSNLIAQKDAQPLTLYNMKPHIFKEILEFMVSGRCSHLPDFPEDILIAAKKLNMVQMLQWCQSELVETVNVKNVLEILRLAKKFNLQELATRAMEVIVANPIKICSTSEWKWISRIQPELVCQAFQALAQLSAAKQQN